MSTVLAIPDMHLPFNHRDALPFLEAVTWEPKYAPDEVVCLGDIIDYHALSQYVSDPDGYSAGEEHKAAMRKIEDVYELFPEVKGCLGNHDIRAYKKAFNAGIPNGYLKDFNEIIGCPDGWQWADEWEIDGVLYHHGNGYTGVYATRQMLLSKMQSVVHGHTHSLAGVIHIQTSESHHVFGMNCGCLTDDDAYAAAYAKFARTKGSKGCGVIIDGVPFWVPMLMNKSGKRWSGKIV